jgi:ankyrin repeat protein
MKSTKAASQNRCWIGHIFLVASLVCISCASSTALAQADMPWTKVKCQVRQFDGQFKRWSPDTTALKLMKSIQSCAYQETIQLIDSGVDLNFEDELGDTPLALAITFGENSIILELLTHGADPNRTSRRTSWGTALMGAALTGNLEGTRLLLENGAKPDMVDVYKGTALMYAAEGGETEIVRLLMAHGADPRLRDEFGKTARDSAINANHWEIVPLLESAGEK